MVRIRTVIRKYRAHSAKVLTQSLQSTMHTTREHISTRVQTNATMRTERRAQQCTTSSAQRTKHAYHKNTAFFTLVALLKTENRKKECDQPRLRVIAQHVSTQGQRREERFTWGGIWLNKM